jgi:hypothetical protein
LEIRLSLSLHEASVPVMVRMLRQLAHLLHKAVAYAEANHLDPASLIEARLAPDMFPLARQVQSASDAAKACAARLAGLQPPSFPDTETTFPELQERIAKTIAFVETVGAGQIDGGEDRPITLTLRGSPVAFTGRTYLFQFALPNFFFHVTTAYAVLRHKGVPLGKMDYLGEA